MTSGKKERKRELALEIGPEGTDKKRLSTGKLTPRQFLKALMEVAPEEVAKKSDA